MEADYSYSGKYLTQYKGKHTQAYPKVPELRLGAPHPLLVCPCLNRSHRQKHGENSQNYQLTMYYI